jgi:signal transduction histidine kinase
MHLPTADRAAAPLPTADMLAAPPGASHAPVAVARPAWAGRPAATTVLRWLAISAAGCLLLACWRYAQIGDDFTVDARARHGMLAQRMDQHDAHLTSLAAVAQLDDPGHASFDAVAAAVRKYYPRVVAVQLVRLAPTAQVVAASGGTAMPVDEAAVRTLTGSLEIGKAGVIPRVDGAGYALVKRLRTDVPTALVLLIDSGRLTETDTAGGPPLFLSLTDANGVVFGRTPAPADARGWLPTLRVDQDLPSASQPLRLTVQRRLTLAELLPSSQVLLVLLASAGMLWLAHSMRRARQARREAALRTQEVRLAHAMRVNGLGEMASGIAHELTQPMTAVLGQSQAGLRLIERGATTGELVPVLQANVKLAKRAGDILARMRSYVTQRAPATERIALDELVAGAVALARADLSERGVALATRFEAPDSAVQVDPVSIEQVLHNLLRNAAEAMEAAASGTACIAVRTGVDAGGVYIEVSDNGPGLGRQDPQQLFAPFFTTKPGGMGLGLSICERLVEAAGGRIDVAAAASGGACFTIHLPAA